MNYHNSTSFKVRIGDNTISIQRDKLDIKAILVHALGPALAALLQYLGAKIWDWLERQLDALIQRHFPDSHESQLSLANHAL